MPISGFVSLAFGVSGLFALVQQALAAYRRIDSARYFGENVYRQFVLFEHQYFRFESWYSEMKVLQSNRDASADSESGDSLPSTHESKLAVLGPSQQLCNAIAQIISILQAVEALCEKYKLEGVQTGKLPETSAKVYSVDQGIITTTIGGAIASDGKLAFASQQKRIGEELLQKRTGLLKRIIYGTKLWKDADKDHFESLIKQFSGWNDSLQDFLPSPRRILIDLMSSLKLLASEDDPRELEQIRVASSGTYNSLSRRAALKLKNLDQNQHHPSDFKKPLEWISPIRTGNKSSKSRVMASYSDPNAGTDPEAVLIEWKSYAGLTEYDQVVAAENHVKDLVHVLSVTQKPPLLRTLTCHGYYQDDDPERKLFGFIYKLPAHTTPTSPPLSLHTLLCDAKNAKRTYPLPSLSQRICIAQKLAISFLELHNVRWLHKAFHSDNVIFFSRSNGRLDLASPYITGFEFSRPEEVAAFSFDVRKSEMDIYRHPTLRELGANRQQRPRYQKRHDIYSLGMVLLEIGLWQPLSMFEKTGMSGNDVYRRIVAVARSELAHRVGDIFQEVVLKCITGDRLFDAVESGSMQTSPPLPAMTTAEPVPGSDAGGELLKYYWGVVRELEKCHCGHKQD